jgi:hypothetical protein
MILNIMDNPPDFVNEIGTKWWKEPDITRYAQKEDRYGIKISAVAFLIETVDKFRSFVLVSKDTNMVIAEDQTFEGMGCKIDILKLLEREKDL